MLEFQANQNQESAPKQPREIPAPGEYIAEIMAATDKESKTGGRYLELRLDLWDEQTYMGKQWTRLNYQNRNPIAVDIAKKTLLAIAKATGLVEEKEKEMPLRFDESKLVGNKFFANFILKHNEQYGPSLELLFNDNNPIRSTEDIPF